MEKLQQSSKKFVADLSQSLQRRSPGGLEWHHRVAVKELNLSYYTGETISSTICSQYGNFIYVP